MLVQVQCGQVSVYTTFTLWWAPKLMSAKNIRTQEDSGVAARIVLIWHLQCSNRFIFSAATKRFQTILIEESHVTRWWHDAWLVFKCVKVNCTGWKWNVYPFFFWYGSLVNMCENTLKKYFKRGKKGHDAKCIQVKCVCDIKLKICVHHSMGPVSYKHIPIRSLISNRAEMLQFYSLTLYKQATCPPVIYVQ